MGSANGYNTINCINSQAFVTSGFINGSVDMDPGPSLLTLTTTTNNFFDALYGFTTTALNEYLETENIIAYPNPTSNLLFFENETNTLAQLFNLNGKEMTSKTLIPHSKICINVSGLAAGLYILKVGNSFQKINVLH